MKLTKLLLVSALALSVSQAMALTPVEQQRSLAELESAKADIRTIKTLIPKILRSTIGAGLDQTEQKITNVQVIISRDRVEAPEREYHHEPREFVCVISHPFRGDFLGKGPTPQEAQYNARQACVQGSGLQSNLCKRDCN